jgi:hypothetical protein
VFIVLGFCPCSFELELQAMATQHTSTYAAASILSVVAWVIVASGSRTTAGLEIELRERPARDGN